MHQLILGFIRFKCFTWFMHKRKVTRLGLQTLYFPKSDYSKVYNGHRIDYSRVGVLRGQRHIPSKFDSSTPPLPPTPPFLEENMASKLVKLVKKED